jgi:hypothetical protein
MFNRSVLPAGETPLEKKLSLLCAAAPSSSIPLPDCVAQAGSG